MKLLSRLKTIKSLGNKKVAESVANRTFSEIPAYKKFLATNGFNSFPNDFENLPITSKNSYILPADHLELSAGDDQTVFYHRSSSLNNSLYWPQPKIAPEQLIIMKQYLEQHYHAHQVKSMCIVGAALGSWAGGQNFICYLEKIVQLANYPISIFIPGNNVEEIIEFIQKYDHIFPQFILFLCPSFIAYIFDSVESLGLHEKFPFHKLRFCVIGEPITESFRLHMDTICKVNPIDSSLFSFYGSADSNLIGAESIASVAVRKLIHLNKSLAQYFNTLPHFFHYYAQDSYIEEINEELCITKWQGIPLVRYNMNDRVQLYSWKELREYMLSYQLDGQQNKILSTIIEKAGENLPDIVALFGRSDSNLKVKGSFISEEILDYIMHSKPLSEFLTGYYKASVEYDEHDHQYISVLLELKPSVEQSFELSNFFYNKIIASLCDLQHEFKKDYEEVYKVFDDDLNKQILRLKVCQWPTLSNELEKKTKRRGI